MLASTGVMWQAERALVRLRRSRLLAQTTTVADHLRCFRLCPTVTANRGIHLSRSVSALSLYSKTQKTSFEDNGERDQKSFRTRHKANSRVGDFLSSGPPPVPWRCTLQRLSTNRDSLPPGSLRRFHCKKDDGAVSAVLHPVTCKPAEAGHVSFFASNSLTREGLESSYCARASYSGLLFLSTTRFMWHRGVLELFCSSCRYVVRRWHVPILGVDCSANPRHKQALTSPAPRSRGIPKHLIPYLVGKQAPRHPRWRQEHMLRARATHFHRAGLRRNG